MIDSDFDLNHADIRPSLVLQRGERADDTDNNGNGHIDDVFGLHYRTRHGQSNDVRPGLVLDTGFKRPFSHGTHVASLLVRNQPNVALTFYTFPKKHEVKEHERYHHFLQLISGDIKSHKIRLVNMSIGTPGMFANGPQNIVARAMLEYAKFKRAYTRLIHDNPETLFVAAAGNGSMLSGQSGYDIDEDEYGVLPASVEAKNLLVVGAINRDSMSDENDFSVLTDARLASFSNFGRRRVHVLAPGQNVSAAALGGGQIRQSGTSMATPIAANQAVIPLMRAFSDLKPEVIVRLVVLSALIPDLKNPFPVMSGGIIHPARTKKAAAILMQNNMSPLQAVLQSLRSEGVSSIKLARRCQFWQKRGLISHAGDCEVNNEQQ